MSNGPSRIRRGASHDLIWKLWSAAEAKRLKALPPPELLLAVQTGAIVDLTEDDQKQVLAALAAGGHQPPVDAAAVKVGPQRRPIAVNGKGLPCTGRPLVRAPWTRIYVAAALAIGAWVAVIGFGYASLTPQLYASP